LAQLSSWKHSASNENIELGMKTDTAKCISMPDGWVITTQCCSSELTGMNQQLDDNFPEQNPFENKRCSEQIKLSFPYSYTVSVELLTK